MLHALMVLVTIIALGLISLTMLLRCHEHNEKDKKAMLRKVGLLLSGVAPVGLGLGLMFGWNLHFYLFVFSIGLFLTFFTTPSGVPWHKWVWHSLEEAEQELREDLEREAKKAADKIGMS